MHSYAFQSIPKDPLTGLREWRNNKMSACWRGFVMDETVKDQEPSEEIPEPQFSMGESEWKIALRSMPEPESGVTDTRPNGWDSEHFNWAKLHLNGFKIHHMEEKNWARNAHVEISDWQLSDNTRSLGFYWFFFVMKCPYRNPIPQLCNESL